MQRKLLSINGYMGIDGVPRMWLFAEETVSPRVDKRANSARSRIEQFIRSRRGVQSMISYNHTGIRERLAPPQFVQTKPLEAVQQVGTAFQDH